MFTAPALSVKKGRPTKDTTTLSDLRMDVHAWKGEAKRMAISVAPMVHRLATDSLTPSQRSALEGDIYSALLGFLKRAP